MLVFAADLHGEWLELYNRLPTETKAIFVCGDAEPIRSEQDLELIPDPKKYLKPGNFCIFWEKSRVPVPTYVLLGNHEPYLWLHPYEKEGPKELIPNFWILGRSGVIELCGVKIAYLSRVFSPKTYFEGAVWIQKRTLGSRSLSLPGGSRQRMWKL